MSENQEMDIKNFVFNAARDGRLRRLKVFLEQRTKEEVQMLVGARTGGATPLVMACRNGHYDVAEYLVERCGADIEQPGSVMFDGETIEGAPPLWCAAAAGHLSVVRLLVRHGACVNNTTRTNSTPLRAACFDGHFEIVKFLVDNGADIEVANRHGHTCLMIACYKGHFRIAKFLLSLNASVNRKSVKGNTALHDCAESGSLEILKLLIAHGAQMDVDSYGMTPLLAASVTGHTHIVEYLIKLPNLVSRHERVDALELLGATYVDKKRDMIGALGLWKRAMDDRFPQGEPPLPKPVQVVTVAAYDHAREVTDHETLEELLADPDEMRMQALVIRERILGPAHPDTSYYVRYRGAVYADAGKFSRCIALWNYALDMQQRMLDPLNQMTQSSLSSFAELFAFMAGEQGRPAARGRRVPEASFEEVLDVLRKAVREVEAGSTQLDRMPAAAVGERETLQLRRAVVVALQLACLLARLLPGLDEARTFELHCTVYRLAKAPVTHRLGGATPLHVACAQRGGGGTEGGRYPACRLPSAAVVSLLLASGANADAKDDDGCTPLHFAAGATTELGAPSLIRTLLEGGAHLDARNGQGRTFEQLLPAGVALHELINPVRYTTLTCLAAATIRKYNVPYRGQIPVSLEEFVARH
ncbi:protein fem-1 homolog CG6966 isoform X1 [Schistocerca americana]|uniref:protein fem-1 homolog CG6966 n=2 Tax=Schistocerca TaxID=7008 RepID=UPI001F4F5B81|nr:protein fem-1 homolog CG6966 isoform X1 [Schistocerca americana]XP_047121077.1 protein fem-1 homolog CG6966 [Schistocerca piceifrons]XP_049765040.1 protein fem-1 homolog CG6966 [Schistocerca cancellata]XP_049791031.1 protein fem-1 homolog CG6966 [Schistocerca nitens]XP_049836450.1 protein fem-1 homolog CG6966 [Schistocerca gregaria]